MANTIITKPWGSETILSETDLPYTFKLLKINAGKKLSLQYHDLKLETLTLISGQTQIIWGQSETQLKTEEMVVGMGYTIRPNIIHRFVAITDSLLAEASTGEVGTTHRLQDDANRPDETEELRSQPNRGWSNS
ncbi:MAG: cupin [Microgenomates group bacterium]